MTTPKEGPQPAENVAIRDALWKAFHGSERLEACTWADARLLAEAVEHIVAARVADALDQAAQDALSSPSTRVGDLHPGEVWAKWLRGRAAKHRLPPAKGADRG